MVREVDQDRPQEETVWALRDSIAQRLKEKGGSADVLKRGGAPQINIDFVSVISNYESRDRWGGSALIVDADGNWIYDYNTAAVLISPPTIDRLLKEFAEIKEPDYSGLPQRQGSREDLANRQNQYIKENKPRLLGEFIGALETTLQGISAQ